MKRGKKYLEKAKLVDRSVLYDVNEAFELIQKLRSLSLTKVLKHI